MFNFLAIVHVIASVILIVFILLQDPKGGAMGMFGGGSSSLFGSTGANHFLLNITKWTAIIFACTSIYLAALSAKKSTSVIDDYVPQTAPAVTPVEPENTPKNSSPENNKEPEKDQTPIKSSLNFIHKKNIFFISKNTIPPLKKYYFFHHDNFLKSQKTFLMTK